MSGADTTSRPTAVRLMARAVAQGDRGGDDAATEGEGPAVLEQAEDRAAHEEVLDERGADGLVGGRQILDVADEHAGADAEHSLEQAVDDGTDGEQHPGRPGGDVLHAPGERPDGVREQGDEDGHPQMHRLPAAQLLADDRVDEVAVAGRVEEEERGPRGRHTEQKGHLPWSQRAGAAAAWSVGGWVSSIVVMGAPSRRDLTAR